MTRVEVYLDVAGVSGQTGVPVLVGHAFFTRSRAGVTTTFAYDPTYLNAGGPNIDPNLTLGSSPQYFPGLLGAFGDTAPDRWGRNLLDKAERLRAAEEKRAPRQLDDLDYLLGVSDNTRQGALRFKAPGGEFVGRASAVPPMVSLPHLLHLADQVSGDEDPGLAVKALLDTGTTGLGGARPKASVTLGDGALAIAKFPHASDQWDVLAWEGVALSILRAAGVGVPEFEVAKVGPRNVLIVRRFDRERDGTRVPYISAMTALGMRDGEHADYLDLADSVRDLSGSPAHDLGELFDRVVLSVLLGNTDDHLRNHGFLWREGGWRLAPAFDVNPNPHPGARRSTSIMGADKFPEEMDALIGFAEACDVPPADARVRISELRLLVAGWEQYARRAGLTGKDVSVMEEALAQRTAPCPFGA